MLPDVYSGSLATTRSHFRPSSPSIRGNIYVIYLVRSTVKAHIIISTQDLVTRNEKSGVGTTCAYLSVVRAKLLFPTANSSMECQVARGTIYIVGKIFILLAAPINCKLADGIERSFNLQ